MSGRSVKRVALGLGVVAVGIAVAVACAQAQPVGGQVDKKPFAVTTVVVFDVKEKSVTPQIGLLRKGDEVQLLVKGLERGQTLEIDFRVQGAPSVKGPFRRTQKWRGRYTFAADGQIKTGPIDTPGPTVWKYDVVLRDKDDTQDVWAIDPMVVERE